MREGMPGQDAHLPRRMRTVRQVCRMVRGTAGSACETAGRKDAGAGTKKGAEQQTAQGTARKEMNHAPGMIRGRFSFARFRERAGASLSYRGMVKHSIRNNAKIRRIKRKRFFQNQFNTTPNYEKDTGKEGHKKAAHDRRQFANVGKMVSRRYSSGGVGALRAMSSRIRRLT